MLIGITGKKGSGKTTLAQYLCSKGYVEKTFAEPLKDICILLGAPRSSVYGSLREKERVVPELGVSGRCMMQRVGTDLFRNYFSQVMPEYLMEGSSTIWVRLMDLWLQRNLKNRELIVVSDVRFADEAALIEKYGGVLFCIEREGLEEVQDTHISEGFRRGIVLENNRRPEDLFQLFEQKMKELEERARKKKEQNVYNGFL